MGDKETNIHKLLQLDENSDENPTDSSEIFYPHDKKKSGSVYIDREEFLRSHRDLTIERRQLFVRNNVLHRKLSEFYKKRKLDHVLKPLEGAMDLEEKYQLKLFAYQEIKEKGETELENMRKLLDEVTAVRNGKEEHLEQLFKGLQDHEKATGTGLIYVKKGKPIADKTVQRMLSLQKSKTQQARAMMLRFIRVRNAVTEQEAIIKGLEKVGPGLTVAAYEQLRVDKLNFFSKLEERDDELIRLRNRCTEHNQMLAHIREKMHHTAEVIDFTECEFGFAEIEYQKARELLTNVKTRRDKLRDMTIKEYMKAGLLTKKSLLYDFQESLELVVKLRDRKVYLENQIEKMNRALRKARHSIVTTEPKQLEDDDIFLP